MTSSRTPTAMASMATPVARCLSRRSGSIAIPGPAAVRCGRLRRPSVRRRRPTPCGYARSRGIYVRGCTARPCLAGRRQPLCRLRHPEKLACAPMPQPIVLRSPRGNGVTASGINQETRIDRFDLPVRECVIGASHTALWLNSSGPILLNRVQGRGLAVAGGADGASGTNGAAGGDGAPGSPVARTA